ncbi:MAG: glycosyltransferase [Pseudomonadota bacterium]|nr:glycosyltransferase [Pseudomonadota bacterium]
MSRPVSIAVLTYNQEAFVGQTLDSILSQDYPDFRIIVSDDASRDGTVAIVRDYIRRYPGRIVLQAHEKNLGITANCHSAVPLLQGDYVCWFAGDDLFLPGKLSRQAAVLDANPDAVFCYHDVEVFDSNTGQQLYTYNSPLAGQKPREGLIAESLLMHGCFLPTMGIMLRRSAVGKTQHRSEIRTASDWMYFTEIAHQGRVIFIPEVLARYRRHSGNTTKRMDCTDEEKSYSLMRDGYPQYAAAIDYGLARLYMTYTFKFLAAGHLQKAGLSLQKLLGVLRRRPRALGFATARIAGTFIQRLALFRRTGSIFR